MGTTLLWLRNIKMTSTAGVERTTTGPEWWILGVLRSHWRAVSWGVMELDVSNRRLGRGILIVWTDGQ